MIFCLTPFGMPKPTKGNIEKEENVDDQNDENLQEVCFVVVVMLRGSWATKRV